MADEMEVQTECVLSRPKRVLKLRKNQVRHLSDAQLEALVEGPGVMMPPDSVADCDTSLSGCSVFC